MGKTLTGVVVSPYNTLAAKFFPNRKLSREFEFSSALIHLVRVVECIFTACVLPLVCLVSPDRAYNFMSHRYLLQDKWKKNHEETLNREINELKTSTTTLQNNLQNNSALLQQKIEQLEQETKLHQQVKGQVGELEQKIVSSETLLQQQALEISQKEAALQESEKQKTQSQDAFESNKKAFHIQQEALTKSINDLKAEQTKLTNNLQTHALAVAQKTSELEQEKQSHQQAQAQIIDLQKIITSLNDQIGRHNVELQAKQAAFDALQQKTTTLQTQLESKINESALNEKNLITQIDALKADVVTLQNNLSTIDQQSKEQVNQSQVAIDLLVVKLQQKETDLQNILQQKNQFQNDLEQNMRHSNAEKETLNEEIRQLKEQQNSLKDELAAQTHSLNIKISLHETETQRASELETKIAQLQDEITLSKENFDKCESNLKQKEADHKAILQQNEELQSQLDLTRNQSNTLQETLNKEITELKAQQSLLKSELEAKTSSVQQNSSEWKQEKELGQQMRVEILQLKKEINSLKDCIDQQAAKLKQKEEDIHRLTEISQQEKESLLKAQQEIEKNKIEIQQSNETVRDFKKRVSVLGVELASKDKNLTRALHNLTETSQKIDQQAQIILEKDEKIRRLEEENKRVQEAMANYNTHRTNVDGETFEALPDYLPEEEPIPLIENQVPEVPSLDSSIIVPLGEGKVKLVWQKINRDPSLVYYTGKNKAAEVELKEEVDKAAEIQRELKKQFPDQKEFYLAIDLNEVEQTKKIKDSRGTPLYTVQCKKADVDLEKYLNNDSLNKKLEFLQRLEIGSQVLQGLSYLHATDYVQGDLKPENILVFNVKDSQPVVRIADFGKAIKIVPGIDNPMRGNPRFSPPEFETTKKGEVFSAAIVLIRILEEAFLQKTPLKRRGIEKYLIDHSACNQIDQWVTFSGISNAVVGATYGFGKTLFGTSGKRPVNPDAEKAVHTYIEKFIESLSEKLNPAQAHHLRELLKDMTLNNPDNRPTMEKAVNRYKLLLGNELVSEVD